MNTVTPFDKPELTADELAYRYTRAQKRLAEAKKEIQDIEDQIIEKVGAKTEGAFKYESDNYVITTTGKLTRTINESKLAEIQDRIPTPLFDRMFSYKPKLNLAEYRYVEANEPEYFAIVATAITTKAAKTSITVKEI